MNEKVKAVKALRAAAQKSTEDVKLVPDTQASTEIVWCAFQYGYTCTRCTCFKNRKYQDQDGLWRSKMDLQDHQRLIAIRAGIEFAHDGNW